MSDILMGRILLLARHGNYSYTTGHLNPQGQSQADGIATALIENRLMPDRILHSPLPRAVETAGRIATVFNERAGTSPQMEMAPWLSDDSTPDPEYIKKFDDTAGIVLAITHQPVAYALAMYLARLSFAPDYAETCVLKSDAASWQDVRHMAFVQTLAALQ